MHAGARSDIRPASTHGATMEDTTTARLVTGATECKQPTRMGSDTSSYVHYMALRRGCGGELTSSMKGRAEPWARDTYESVKWMIVSATPAFAIK